MGAVAPYAARNFAHLYVVSGRQHSIDAVADSKNNYWQE